MTCDRRHFLAASGAVVASSLLRRVPVPLPLPTIGPLYRAVKWGMIQTEGGVQTRFELMKELGYDGMELISPLGGLDKKELIAASLATGMPIHGVVDDVHWRQDHRLSSPDPAARARGRAALEQAIRDAHDLGGSSVLLVPGVVDEKEGTNHDQVWERSTEEIRKALPIASKLGVHILIENVWNGFCYTPEQLAEYLDGIASPWIGAYFDIGNHVKYGKSEHWVRTLGRRIVKMDVKDWGEKNGFCKIGDGDCDWPEVRKAISEIGFSGWVTAEVSGGKKERLADIRERMVKVLGS
jgi:L-ribulose-5-phosphate 3-epimerase